MNKKVLIVGGVTGGASAAARLRRLDEEAHIVMFERDPYLSRNSLVQLRRSLLTVLSRLTSAKEISMMRA
ncbi:hypothetical protein MKZ24_20680 [Paenibacillus sp. FSL R7-0297]|uniref:hypothetical protein n=1 Tax=unclassified Paenibacillus TaxID=185978 RepID=UPI0009DF1B9C|nr:hypothetical protein [Paenibacillus sp. FSL R5-0912]